MNMVKTRCDYLDEISGLFIIHMILWHCFQNAGMMDCSVYRILSRLFFFFMPWFFYKSGIFFNPQKTFKEIVSAGFKRLLIPFISFFLMGLLCWMVHLFFTSGLSVTAAVVNPMKELLLYGSCNGNLALWFLLTLFFVRILYWIVSKVPCSSVVQIVVLFGLVVLCSNFGPHKPYYVGNTFLGLFFFSLGRATFSPLQGEGGKRNLLIAVSGFVWLSVVLFDWTRGDARTNAGRLYEGWLLASVAGILAVNFLGAKKNRKLGILSKIGRSSMVYFVVHWPLIILIKAFLVDLLGWENHLKVLCVMIFFLLISLPLISWFVNRKMKWIVGA